MKEKSLIAKLYTSYSGTKAREISALPKSGSDRKYFRLENDSEVVVAVYNPNHEENDTFVGFSKHFRNKGLPVPKILKFFRDESVYFQSFLGDTNLYTWLEQNRQLEGNGEEINSMYKLVLDRLIDFQIKGIKGLDLDLCYPHRSFDEQSMMWDMNYFKYMFLKLVAVPFNEKSLEKDFDKLKNTLLRAGNDFFLYRDFQSANIMIFDGEPWFIDYQGGRSGAPQYDVASLLYDSKAHIPQQSRELLLEYYIDNFNTQSSYPDTLFRELYPAFVLVRIMQALGAYGFRGLFEQKPGFVQSIIPAVRDINYILSSGSLGEELPELSSIMRAILETRKFESLKEPETLRIKLGSFSYMNGLPQDAVHGGGFIFDCRGLINPGKMKEFINLSGLDKEVGLYMETDPVVGAFLENAYNMVSRSIESYRVKNYTSLAVSFGCTGGKHRSVYCADRLALMLKSIKGINIEVTHRDIEG